MVATVFGMSLRVCAQNKNDSVSTTLNELTVTAENRKMDTNTTTYYPSSKVKRAAQDAIDLLRRMAINQIRIDPVDQKIKTDTREDVVVYIDYLPAGEGEIDGLKSTDVSKVEFISFSTDPRFEGNPYVINILLHKYAYGGYTKISDSQSLVSSFKNSGSVFSRFAYGKMTYDLYAGEIYTNSSHSGYYTNSVFRLADYTVKRDETLKSSEKNSLNVPVTFRATYNTNKVSIANMVGFTFLDMMHNVREGSLSMGLPDAMEEYSYRYSTPLIARSLTWMGNYYFTLPKKWNLYLIPIFAYRHGNNHSNYSSDAEVADLIVNYSREDAYSATIQTSLSKAFNGGHSFSVNLNYGYMWNNVEYLDNSPSTSHSRNNLLVAKVLYSFRHGNNFNASIQGMLSNDWYDTNGIKDSQLAPDAMVSISYLPNRKNRFLFTMRYKVYSLSGIFRQDKVLRRNEYLYETGNPLLGSYGTFNTNLSYTFLAGNRFTLQAFSKYTGMYDRVVSTYMLYDNGNAILYKPEKSGDYTGMSAGVNLTWNMLPNTLTLQVSPEFTHSSSTGFHHLRKNQFSYSLDAQYYFGNFNASVSYQSLGYTMEPATGNLSKNLSYYIFQLGWSNAGLNITISANNVFRSSYWAQWNTMKTSDYDIFTGFEIPEYHCTLNLRATYTFGYGKKVKRGNEINALSGAAPSAL